MIRQESVPCWRKLPVVYTIEDRYANQRATYGELITATTMFYPPRALKFLDTCKSFYNIYYFSTEEKRDAFFEVLHNKYRNQKEDLMPFKRVVAPTDREGLREHALQELDKLRSAILNDEVILLNTTVDYTYSDEESSTLSICYIRKQAPSMTIDEYLTGSLTYNSEANQWEIQGG